MLLAGPRCPPQQPLGGLAIPLAVIEPEKAVLRELSSEPFIKWPQW